MNYLLEFFYSFFATVGFAVAYSTPKKSIIYCAIIGAISWSIYKIIKNSLGNIYFAFFIASFTGAIIGEIFARILKKPSSIYIIPGITTLYPGAAIYYTMYYFVTNNQQKYSNKLSEALITAGIIAFGVLVASAGSKSINNFKFRKRK